MRVIAGSLGGRTFDSPGGHRTHPMSEKIRGALFNALGDITGLTVLDAFAGSGAVSIEALSRGATLAVAIDDDARAFAVIVNNAQELGISTDLRAANMTVRSWHDKNKDRQFDIVAADPPYDKANLTDLELLATHVTNGGIFVVSLPPEVVFEPKPDGLTLLQQKQYGDATLAFYRKIS